MTGDPGCFAPFLLNIYKLQPGEAIYVPAGEIHAYISGDCIEVQKCISNCLFILDIFRYSLVVTMSFFVVLYMKRTLAISQKN